MKYLVLLGDGMADEPLAELDGRTPLEVAHTPNLDRLASCGELGLAHTVPEGFHPGSDVANLSVFGYDPHRYYSGRAPLEAASMGVTLVAEDVALRLNLVELSHYCGAIYMVDFTAGHIATDEARQIIHTLQQELGDEQFEFYPGVSYRHLLVWRQGSNSLNTVPPHDLIAQDIAGQLPSGERAKELHDLMNSAQMLLNRHPVNAQREQQGQAPANSIWLWGQGRRPAMPTLRERFGIQGTVISAVDLIKGIGTYAGLDVVNVPGATGYLDTNYAGKAQAALAALQQQDFVYLHVEAPDEAGHSGSSEAKIQAIEDFDAKIVGPVLAGLEQQPFAVLALPDHPTPLALRTHTNKPVPYTLCTSDQYQRSPSETRPYTEQAAAASGFIQEQGWTLLSRLLNCR